MLHISSSESQRELNLEALVSHLGDLNSTDPRDRIFSLLGIAKDGIPKNPNDVNLSVNYARSVGEVYAGFVKHSINASKSLDIICRHWASAVPNSVILPTWVRPVQFSSRRFDGIDSSDVDAESLVGLPNHKYYLASRYNASKGIQAEYETYHNPNSLPLLVRGLRLDTISKLAPRASEAIITKEWLELGGCGITQAIGHTAVPDSFWRTLVANRGPNGSSTPSWYKRAFLYCLQHLTPSGDLNTDRIIAEFATGSSFIVDFLHKVQSVIRNRKLLLSRDKQWIGLAPMVAEVGDVISILHGCSVPVILRPTVDTDGKTYARVVGESYIHGIMDGEAFQLFGSAYSRSGAMFELR
jgi:hypothetical protein